MYCVCLRSVSQRTWDSAPHLPARERMRDLENDGGGTNPGNGDLGGDLQGRPLEVPRELSRGENGLILQGPAPNKPEVPSVFRGAGLAV